MNISRFNHDLSREWVILLKIKFVLSCFLHTLSSLWHTRSARVLADFPYRDKSFTPHDNNVPGVPWFMAKYELWTVRGPIFTNNLAKYWYFWTEPSLFDKYYYITYFMPFVAQCMLFSIDLMSNRILKCKIMAIFQVWLFQKFSCNSGNNEYFWSFCR